jgi:formamidopyrimidine-DNA glycosylase
LPELPEVETSCRGIRPHVVGQQILDVIVRQPTLRYPIPPLLEPLVGQRIDAVTRRGKYLLLAVGDGHLLIHLGMSGSLRLVPAAELPGKHDHVDWVLASGVALRFTDPRRFGVVDWLAGDPFAHKLLSTLGPEPLESDFDTGYLYRQSRGRRVPIKSFIMDSHVVVGVGNIYANEALFMAGIHPLRGASRISLERYQRLTAAIKTVLSSAIAQGGTTLRDFVGGDGKPGYFKQSLHVYGRGGLPCGQCGMALKEVRLAQRATVFCPHCQR